LMTWTGRECSGIPERADTPVLNVDGVWKYQTADSFA
jgi:hypothetical protein